MCELGAAAFDRVRRLIQEIAGISLGPTKRTMAMNRLLRRLQATGHDRFSTYLDEVEAPGSPERAHFANALTTNLTSFFREAHHFPMLLDHLRARPAGAPPAVIWSAACSTGEEPYSIAMALHEAGEEVARGVRIIASDIDTEALETAQRAVYPMERAATVGEERLHRFFLRGDGTRRGLAKLRPDVASMVEFRQVNLCARDWSVKGPLAAIFCRNAMIYFAKPTQLEVLQRFAPLLKGGGLLFAGHSENFHYLAGHFLRPRGKTVYETLA
ncbi:MAG TPA: CheR family methyltransferase [Usitatibacter sp.]|nr:CheR family methyltransferase [Usitatibacter sp.]